MATLATPTPIAQLQPGLDPEATSVTGIVTLIWPYASSTQSLSLLLVEPDFRLRRHRGQVRIHFNGASAKAVARSGVTIGDRLSLSLKGSEWARDDPVATTPGKGIEWELRYGESVVLQVQRDSQAPVLLDIDRSALSPESTADATQPRLSPVYRSHIATPTTRAPLLNAHTWESPAFLKRSRFISSCDPLALDEEEDFPDNNRRKRTKFGQGSGLWRFADRTPSPDREPDQDDFAVINPPRPQADERQPPNVADRKPQSSEKIDLIAGIQDDEQGTPALTEDRNEEAGADRQPRDEAQLTHEVTRSVHEKTATNAPPSPSSTNAELSVAAMPEKNTLIKGAATSSSKSVYPVSATSKSDQEPDSEAEAEPEPDYSDSAAFGASDVGLDDPLVPRDQRPLDERSNVDLAIEGAGSMDVDKVNRSPEEAPSPSVSAGAQDYQGHSIKPVTIKESAHEFQIHDGDDSVPGPDHDSVERGTQGFSSVPPSPSRQRSEQRTTETPLFPYILEMPLGVEQQGHQSDERPSYGNGRATSVEEPSTSQSAPAESQEVRKGKVETTTYPPSPRVSKVEIIDLESDDDDGDEAQLISQQPARLPSTESTAPIAENLTKYHDSLTPTGTAVPYEPLPPRSCTPSPSVTDPSRDSIAQPDSVTEKPPAYIGGRSPATATSDDSSVENASDNILQPDTSAGQPPSTKKPFYLAPRAELSNTQKQDLGLRNDPFPKNRRLGPEIGVRHDSSSRESATLKPEDAGQFEDRAPNTQSTETRDPEKVGQLVERKAESQDSFVVLPATVQDSVQVLSPRSQLPTPDTTQPASFTSQPSLSSLKSMSDDDTLPTPRLTQGKPADLVVPIALQVALEPSQGTSPSPSQKHKSLVEEKHSPAKVSTSQRPPTLIEKLKAMKRLSSQTPQKGGDASAVSPWFAPRRSSIIVPDSEAGSEVESMSEGDRKSTKQNGTAKLKTPEKQIFLAKSFIRSPSQWEDIQPITYSPGYIPPSQPPPPGFRTSLSYFVPLATLQSHYNLTVDILAIALLATPIVRAATGARDYYQTIYIADPSSSVLRSPLITVQIFRSHNKCFPFLKVGDALLLRDFKVQSFQRQPSLLSTQSSAWAVFRRDADVQVRGPPVEFGAEERGFARGLWRWWAGLDHKVKASLVDIAPKDKQEMAVLPDTKLDGRVPSKEKRLDNYSEKSVVKVKEGIAGLGVDLPGSQDKTDNDIKKDNSRERKFDLSSSQENTGRPPMKGRSSGPDGVLESIEPPKRVLRPRGARGMAERSESPLKALDRRSGTVFTGGLGEPESD